MTSSYKIKNKVLIFRSILCVFIILSVYGVFQLAFAQSLSLNIYVLRDIDTRHNLASYFDIIPDPDKNLTEQIIAERYQKGTRHKNTLNDYIDMGMKGESLWLVARIRNATWNENWYLSLGKTLEGQTGVFKKVAVIDYTSPTQRWIVNTDYDNISASNVSNVFNHGAFSFNIPKNGSVLLMIYLEPYSGIPTQITPVLLPENTFLQSQRDFHRPDFLLYIYFLVTIGLLLSTTFKKNAWSNILIIFFYATQLALFYIQNETLQSSSVLYVKWIGIVFHIGILIAILHSKLFLRISHFQSRRSQMVIFLALWTVVLSVISLFIINLNSLTYYLLAFFMPLFPILGIIILSLLQRSIYRSISTLYAIAWLIYLAGSLITVLSNIGNLPLPQAASNAYWLALIPHGIILFWALSLQNHSRHRESSLQREEEKKESDVLSVLKKNKDQAEISRLLRLIAHEREVMNELRDREMYQSEKMRLAKEEADMANRSKSAFLAVISHEIRTPMTGIMGMVRLLLDERSLNTKQRDYAQTIEDSGKAMISLLNDILDFEKIDTGNLELEITNFNLFRLVQDIITLMRGHAETKKIELISDIGDEVPKYVQGDPVRLRQVLLNLVGNAVKFTSEGAVTLRLSIDENYMSPKNKNNSVQKTGELHNIKFEVQDTGVGIPEHAQKNLFTPFTQADSSITRKFGGTGLGLAICQKLVSAMGDKIQINSKENEGSIFYFTIPFAAGSQDSINQHASVPISTDAIPKLKILIVEDNEINQKLLGELVSRLGHAIDQALSGEEALKKLEDTKYDLILMDIEMSGMSGVGTTKAIRALPDPEKAMIPIFALTGHIQPTDISTYYQANMNGHIQKPVDPAKLKSMIIRAWKKDFDNPIQVGTTIDDQHTHGPNQISSDTFQQDPHLKEARDNILNAPDITDDNEQTNIIAENENSIETETDADEALPQTSSQKPNKSKQLSSNDKRSLSQQHSADFSPLAKYIKENQEEDISPAPAIEPTPIPAPTENQQTTDNNNDIHLKRRLTDKKRASDFEPKQDETEEQTTSTPTNTQSLFDEQSIAKAAEAIHSIELDGEQSESDSWAPATSLEGPKVTIFNPTMLKTLKDSMPPKDFQQMIEDCTDKVEELVMSVNKLMNQSNYIETKYRLHELKGMAGNFGLSQIETISAKLEEMLKNNKTDDAKNNIENLKHSAGASIKAMKDWMYKD